MATKLFKVRDTVTQKFWNGDYRRSTFNDTGKTWKKRDAVENSVGYFIRYRSHYAVQTLHSLPEKWEIVEVELVERETGTTDMGDFLKFVLLKNEVEKIDAGFSYFMQTMRNKGVIDKIEFMIKLKPKEKHHYVDKSRIMEARAHLRQLGVKTRTFREGYGIFGMMDRQQALRARLTLDVEKMVDLGALRKKLGL
jgi:hypothetical protein